MFCLEQIREFVAGECKLSKDKWMAFLFTHDNQLENLIERSIETKATKIKSTKKITDCL